MRPRLILLIALAAGACSSGPAAKPPESRRESGPAPKPAATRPPDCPEEQLSCGKQKPVVSNGVRPFENEDKGIRAWFPRGDRVCLSRSGDAPHGFYADYETPHPCAERAPHPPGMGIYAEFNLFLASAREAAGYGKDCAPLSQATLHRFGGTAPAFPRHPSIACEQSLSGGVVEISIYTLAGKVTDLDLDDRPNVSAPGVEYIATLRTRADRMDRDVPMFRTFLRKLQVGVPFE